VELPAALTDRVAFLLQLALRRAQAMGEEALADLGLHGREYGLLALLEPGPAAGQRELGAVLGLDRTTTLKLVRGLVDRGLVRRTTAPGDARALVLELTPAGERLRAAAAARLVACDEEFLAPLRPDERAQVETALRRLL
jgi:DNA-binding MarR family transcriptional regulator